MAASAVYFTTLTLLVASVAALVSSAPVWESQGDIARAMIVWNLAKLIERAEEEEAKQQAPKLVQEDKGAATLHGLITKLSDLQDLMEMVNEHLVQEQNLMQINQQEVKELEEEEVKQDVEEQASEVVQEDNFQNLTTELGYLQDLLKKVKEQLIVAKEQFCFNPYGVCCYDGCG